MLIQALTGFVDAGAAGRLAREHLLDHAHGQVVATFDIDALLDYRSRRPVMLFVEDHWESYEEPDARAAPAARQLEHAVPAAVRARSRTCSGSGSPPP